MLLAVTVALLIFIPLAFASACPFGWHQVDQSCFLIKPHTVALDYFSASLACASQSYSSNKSPNLYDPYLPIFKDAFEMDALFSLLQRQVPGFSGTWISGIKNEGYKTDVFSCIPSFDPLTQNEPQGGSRRNNKPPLCLTLEVTRDESEYSVRGVFENIYSQGSVNTDGDDPSYSITPKSCFNKMTHLVCQLHASDWYLENFDTFCMKESDISSPMPLPQRENMRGTHVTRSEVEKEAVARLIRQNEPDVSRLSKSKEKQVIPRKPSKLKEKSLSLCQKCIFKGFSTVHEQSLFATQVMLQVLIVLLVLSLLSTIPLLCVISILLFILLKKGEIIISRSSGIDIFSCRKRSNNISIVC